MRILILAALAIAAPGVAQTIQPGQWQTISTVTSVNMPGAPPMVAAMLKGRPTTVNSCITPEQAKAGPREMLKQAPGCTFNRFTMAAGKMDSEMVCNRGGRTMTTVTTGSYTPVSMTGTGKVTGPDMTMTVAVSGRRVGDCK